MGSILLRHKEEGRSHCSQAALAPHYQSKHSWSSLVSATWVYAQGTKSFQDIDIHSTQPLLPTSVLTVPIRVQSTILFYPDLLFKSSIDFRKRGRGERKRETLMREKHQSVVSGTHPEQGWNPRPFGVRGNASTNEATQPGLTWIFTVSS